MGWEVELAKELKKRDNAKPTEMLIGTVISLEPLRLSALDNKVILTEDNFIICSAIKRGFVNDAYLKKDGTISHTSTGTGDIAIKVKENLKIGDNVLCMPIGTLYYLIDKVG